MEAKDFEALKKEAYESGENDTYIEDRLCESASLWLDEQEGDLTDEQREELIEEYRRGFLGSQDLVGLLQNLQNRIAEENGTTGKDSLSGDEMDIQTVINIIQNLK